MEESLDVIEETLEAVEETVELTTTAVKSPSFVMPGFEELKVIAITIIVFFIIFMVFSIIQGLILKFTNLPRLYKRQPRRFDRTTIAFTNVLSHLEPFFAKYTWGYIVKGYPHPDYGNSTIKSVPLTIFMKNSIARIHFLDGPGDLVCGGNKGFGIELKVTPKDNWLYEEEQPRIRKFKRPSPLRSWDNHEDWTLSDVFHYAFSYYEYIRPCQEKLAKSCFDVIYIINPDTKICFEQDLKKNYKAFKAKEKEVAIQYSTPYPSDEEIEEDFNFYVPSVARNCQELIDILLKKNEDAKIHSKTDEEFTLDTVIHMVNQMQRARVEADDIRSINKEEEEPGFVGRPPILSCVIHDKDNEL